MSQSLPPLPREEYFSDEGNAIIGAWRADPTHPQHLVRLAHLYEDEDVSDPDSLLSSEEKAEVSSILHNVAAYCWEQGMQGLPSRLEAKARYLAAQAAALPRSDLGHHLAPLAVGWASLDDPFQLSSLLPLNGLVRVVAAPLQHSPVSYPVLVQHISRRFRRFPFVVYFATHAPQQIDTSEKECDIRCSQLTSPENTKDVKVMVLLNLRWFAMGDVWQFTYAAVAEFADTDAMERSGPSLVRTYLGQPYASAGDEEGGAQVSSEEEPLVSKKQK